MRGCRNIPALEMTRFEMERGKLVRTIFFSGLVNTIQALLGHKTMAMVMQYSHLTDRHKAEAVAPLDRPEDTKTGSQASYQKVM